MRRKIISITYRRKREGKTNYRKRLKLLLSNKPRLVIRKSNRNISLQLVDYSADGDVVLCSAHSNQLKKYGWKTSRNNIPTAYLTGMLLGRKAVQKKIKEAIADIGLYASTKGSKLYAAMKGAVDAGLYLPHDEEILPSPERLAGSHITAYAKQLRKEPEKFDKQFADYKKQAIEPDKFQDYFEKVKEKIRNENKN